MEKSKQLLAKTRYIIITTIMVILFLEIDLFSPLRFFISSHIVFLENKGTLIGNICLGILGSAILTYVSEYCEYKSIKRKIQNDILIFYRKWHREIEPKTLEYIDNIEYVELIGQNIYQYWEDVYLLYNTYLPYNRNDSFVGLIRALYEYINEFKKYLENRRLMENISKNLEILAKLKKGRSIDSNVNLNEAIELNKKALQKLNKVYESDEKTLNIINDKRNRLNEILPKADILELVVTNKGAENQDFKQDLLNIESEITRQKIKRYLDIKGFLRKIKYKHISIHSKKHSKTPPKS